MIPKNKHTKHNYNQRDKKNKYIGRKLAPYVKFINQLSFKNNGNIKIHYEKH